VKQNFRNRTLNSVTNCVLLFWRYIFPKFIKILDESPRQVIKIFKEFWRTVILTFYSIERAKVAYLNFINCAIRLNVVSFFGMKAFDGASEIGTNESVVIIKYIQVSLLEVTQISWNIVSASCIVTQSFDNPRFPVEIFVMSCEL